MKAAFFAESLTNSRRCSLNQVPTVYGEQMLCGQCTLRVLFSASLRCNGLELLISVPASRASGHMEVEDYLSQSAPGVDDGDSEGLAVLFVFGRAE
jgi:hypothetical protein